MNIPDVNVLVALFHEDSAQHGAAQAWWADSARRGEPFAIPDVVSTGFVRVVTNRRIYATPAELAQAFAFIRALSAHPHCLRYVAGPDTLAHCENASIQARMTGPDLTDAHIAAAAMDYGATVVTFDRDFRKFDNLRVLELA